MAQELVLKINADTAQFTANVNKASSAISNAFTTSIEDAKTSVQALVPMLDKLVTENTKVDNSSKSLKTQFRELQQELTRMRDAGLAGTESFNQLQARAAKLKDTLNDAAQSTRTLSSDTFAFDAAVDIIGNVAAGWQAYEGVLSLTGQSTEDIQKSMQRLMAVMNIANGVQQVANFLTGQSAGKKALDTAAAYAQSIAYRVLGTSVASASTAMGVFGSVLAGTGIGLVVAALAAGVVALTSYASSATKAADAQKELNKSQLDSANSGLKAVLQFYSNEEKIDIARAKAKSKNEEEANKAVTAIQQKYQKLRVAEYNKFLNDTKQLSGAQREEAIAALDTINTELQIAKYDQLAAARQAATKQLESQIDALKSKLSDFKDLQSKGLLPQFKVQELFRIEDSIKVLQDKLNAIKGLTVQVDPFIDAIRAEQTLNERAKLSGKPLRLLVQPQFDASGTSITKAIDTTKAIANRTPINLGFQAQVQQGLIDKAQSDEAELRLFALSEQVKKLSDVVVNTLGGAFTNLFENIFSGSQNAFQAFGQAIAGIIKKLAAAAVTAAIFAAIISVATGGSTQAVSFGSKFKDIFAQLSGIKFAEGGIVTGPTLGLVGEAGKEAIIPLDRLGEVIGSIGGQQSVFVTGQLSGETIYLQQQRVSQRRGRFV